MLGFSDWAGNIPGQVHIFGSVHKTGQIQYMTYIEISHIIILLNIRTYKNFCINEFESSSYTKLNKIHLTDRFSNVWNTDMSGQREANKKKICSLTTFGYKQNFVIYTLKNIVYSQPSVSLMSFFWMVPFVLAWKTFRVKSDSRPSRISHDN